MWPEEYPRTQGLSVTGPSPGDRSQRPWRCGGKRSGPVRFILRFMLRTRVARGPPRDLDDPERQDGVERLGPVARVPLAKARHQAVGVLAGAGGLQPQADPPQARPVVWIPALDEERRVRI